jgi:uncharacterized protein YecE (DUF72 family)
MAKRAKVDPEAAPTLFDLQQPEHGPSEPKRHEIPGITLGTSSFTAKGWERVFYPRGMKTRDFLSHYAKRFRAVEIDSTFYGTPRPSTVANWQERTPADFVFAAKVPQVITHEKVLAGCASEFHEFLETMSLLGEKLGPVLFQFPKFDKWMLKSQEELLNRLDTLLQGARNPEIRFAVEIRNKDWVDARLTEFLRARNMALALTDTTFLPRPWEMKESLDLITTDFAYVRWIGDRKGIEEVTTTWEKTIVDRTPDMKKWVDLSRSLIQARKLRHIFLFANNHYAGFAPATVELFERLWQETKD